MGVVEHLSQRRTPSTHHIETRPAPAVAGGAWVIHDLQLAANQLGRVVDRAAGQKLQRRRIHDDLGRARRRRLLVLENGVLVRIDLACGFQRNQILEPMAPTAGDGDAEVVVGVLFLGGRGRGGWIGVLS